MRNLQLLLMLGNVKSGTDAALAMAMGHVILKEYYIDKETPYFKEYTKEVTDMPFLVRVGRHQRCNTTRSFLKR